MHFEYIKWQHAVYTRQSSRNPFSFSHSNTTNVKKAFPPSLSVPYLRKADAIHRINLEEFRNATVLVLVTGGWAVHVSIEAFQKANNSIDRLPMERYDHLERLRPADTAECDELTNAYRALKYHCTMANYSAGERHTWQIGGVAPVLSDVVILPRLLQETHLKPVISSFCRATRKALKDSLILAGGGRVREESLKK